MVSFALVPGRLLRSLRQLHLPFMLMRCSMPLRAWFCHTGAHGLTLGEISVSKPDSDELDDGTLFARISSSI
jgi:hypothetical protein